MNAMQMLCDGFMIKGKGGLCYQKIATVPPSKLANKLIPMRVALFQATSTVNPAAEVVSVVVVGNGVAMGVVGSYETPLRVAATSKTDPPPYS